ncbi:WD40-repeat-containing domain protein, partial [Pisolithus tinctorius]
SRFATVSRDHGCLVYSTHNGRILFDSGKKGSTNSLSRTPLTWSSDGQQLFVGSQGKITCFDISKSLCSEWSIHENQPRVPVASNGRFVACAAGSSVSLWDCMSHKQIGGTITHTTEINCIALSPSGRYLACGSADGKITVHNLKDVLVFAPAVSVHPPMNITSLTIHMLHNSLMVY